MSNERKEAPDALEIVKAYLEAHGYDGLYHFDNECACLVEDLAPCQGELGDGCTPGYKGEPNAEGRAMGCEWMIWKTKELAQGIGRGDEEERLL